MEGSDPTTYEMILKIQMLQKRLIAKTEEVVEKDLLIQVGGSGKGGLKPFLPISYPPFLLGAGLARPGRQQRQAC